MFQVPITEVLIGETASIFISGHKCFNKNTCVCVCVCVCLSVFSGGSSLGASQVAQMVKNPPALWETWVQSLGWENPLEKEMAIHSSIPA